MIKCRRPSFLCCLIPSFATKTLKSTHRPKPKTPQVQAQLHRRLPRRSHGCRGGLRENRQWRQPGDFRDPWAVQGLRNAVEGGGGGGFRLEVLGFAWLVGCGGLRIGVSRCCEDSIHVLVHEFGMKSSALMVYPHLHPQPHSDPNPVQKAVVHPIEDPPKVQDSAIPLPACSHSSRRWSPLWKNKAEQEITACPSTDHQHPRLPDDLGTLTIVGLDLRTLGGSQASVYRTQRLKPKSSQSPSLTEHRFRRRKFLG